MDKYSSLLLTYCNYGLSLKATHFKSSFLSQQPLLLSALAGRRPALGLSLLGAGSGPGSCFAPPYRVANVEFPAGCPPDLSCCNEFGYCRSEVLKIGTQFIGSELFISG